MTAKKKSGVSRRDVLKTAGTAAAVSAFAGMSAPLVHAGENNNIQFALIGCGGRGTGAADQALSTKSGPIKLVAMADVFENRLSRSCADLKKAHPDTDVPDDHKFIGFDAYQKAMDCLRPGDIAIFATPPAFRWVHFRYAIKKGLNVFMEKPITVDAPTTHKLLALAEESENKNLKVGVGLMFRHCKARQELHKRIEDGEIGGLTLLRGYRMAGQTATVGPKPADISELLYQVRHFHSFLWASGGAFSDFHIHNIDECCWMKNAWPIRANATGGRHYRGNSLDQNFDTYTIEYTFADGTKFYLEGRNETGCHDEFASYAHGTRASAIISTASHTPGRCRIFAASTSTAPTSSGRPGARAQPLPARMGTSDGRHPRRQALQRGAPRRRGQPGHLHGPHGRPHRPDHHLGRDAASNTSSPRRWTI